LLDSPLAEVEAEYTNIRRTKDAICAESFIPSLRNGQGAHLWSVAAPLFDSDGKRCGAIEVIRDVTEQKRIEQELSQSERKYRELVELANSIIIRWTSDGYIRFLNEFGQRFFGYSAEEIIGRHVIGTIVPKAETSGRDLRQLMKKIGEDPRRFEQNINENIRRNGDRVWISWANRIVPDEQGQVAEILSIGTDITDQRRAENAIARERDLSDNIINSLPGIFYMYDEEGKLIRWSKKAEELTGYSSEELNGRPILHFFPKDYKQTILKNVDTVFSEGENYTEAPLLLKNGKLIPYLFSSRLITLDNKPFILGFGVDITERKRAEEEIHRLHKQLQAHAAELENRVAERTAELATAKERAEESDHLKSAFLAAMSHELRTRLNSIIGFTSIILQKLVGPLNHEQAKQLTMVQDSAHHLLSLINDVLDLSKIEAGKFNFASVPFDMRASVEKVVQTVLPLAQQKGLEIRVHMAPTVGTLISDQRRVEQILLNLLSNAVKFTEKGYVLLTCETDGGWITTTIKDTGIGIEPEDQSKLFKAFQQIETGLSRRFEGSGLGLSICTKLLELLGGKISAKSDGLGHGSTFIFTLPEGEK
jgi:PAS domain S-box-containing protein